VINIRGANSPFPGRQRPARIIGRLAQALA
jgi:hypothetical protein